MTFSSLSGGFGPVNRRWERFSSMFIHADWKHLLGNLLILFIFGDNVEHRLGPRIYLLAYLGMGVCATLFFSAFSMGSNIPLVGASGAISGVLGMYFLWFPLNRVKVFIWFFWFIQVHYLPARIVLGIYLFIDNVLPFLFGGRGGGVAHGAHIGGFVAGLLAAQAIHKLNLFRFRESEQLRSGGVRPMLFISMTFVPRSMRRIGTIW